MPAYNFNEDVLRPGVRYLGRDKKIRGQQTDALCEKHLKAFFTGYWVSHSIKRKGKKLIDGNAVNTFKAYLKQDKGLADGSVERICAVGSAVCNLMRTEFNMEFPNPFHGRIRPRREKKRRRRVNIKRDQWTRDQAAALLLAARPIVQDITNFALNSGFRLSEILQLTETSRFEGEDYTRVYLGEEGWECCFAPKDQKSGLDGAAALNDACVEILGRQTPVEVRELDDQGHPITHRYFFHYNGRPLHRRRFNGWFREDRAKAGLNELLFKHTRKTHGQWLLDAGVPIEHVAEQLRHCDIRTTIEWYVVPTITGAAAGVKLLEPAPCGA